jgi:hypothetical protein
MHIAGAISGLDEATEIGLGGAALRRSPVLQRQWDRMFSNHSYAEHDRNGRITKRWYKRSSTSLKATAGLVH